MGRNLKVSVKKTTSTRKELRKQKREKKKQIKNAFWQKKRTSKWKRLKPGKGVQEPSEPHNSDTEKLFTDIAETAEATKKCEIQNPMDRFINESKKNNKLIQKISSRSISRKRRIDQLRVENEEEDRLIRQLEKKLKIDKKRGQNFVPKCFNDGFDYILELCLPDNTDKIYEADLKVSDELSNVKNVKQQSENDKQKLLEDTAKQDFGSDSEFDSTNSDMVDASWDLESSETDEDTDSPKSESEDDQKSRKFVRTLVPDASDSDEESLEGKRVEENLKAATDGDSRGSGTLEKSSNIYNGKRAGDGNFIREKYIPPQLRHQTLNCESQENHETVQRLRKQLKGWINRLTEANLQTIVKKTEELYMQNSRHDMNHTLCTLILESIITPVAAVERMVLEHALFITIIHANVGSEVGAHFLEVLVKRFDAKLNQIESCSVENKELDNVIILICHLYTFRICQQNLIFELLKRISVELNEKCVECILVILRSVGYALRKDDPGALKTFIGEIREKANILSESLVDNARMKYMLNILAAVKNNNMLKLPNYDPTLTEHLKKLLKGILHNGKYVTTLNITMDDLLSTNQRGKWWIVGSAWTGRLSETHGSSSRSSDTQKFTADLLELAQKHRMNTDDKRNVFCILMTASDQTDAFNQLIELSIKDSRVIPCILIYSCICESVYNPYYAVVAEKLCFFDRKFRMAVMFASWDQIRVMKNLNGLQIENFSKFLAHLVEEGAQSLSVLKVIDYSQIDKSSVKLVRRIMLSILLKDDYTCRKVFEKISSSHHLSSLRLSLKLFLQHFLLRNTNKLGLSEVQLKLMKRRITIADEALSSSSRILL